MVFADIIPSSSMFDLQRTVLNDANHISEVRTLRRAVSEAPRRSYTFETLPDEHPKEIYDPLNKIFYSLSDYIKEASPKQRYYSVDDSVINTTLPYGSRRKLYPHWDLPSYDDVMLSASPYGRRYYPSWTHYPNPIPPLPSRYYPNYPYEPYQPALNYYTHNTRYWNPLLYGAPVMSTPYSNYYGNWSPFYHTNYLPINRFSSAIPSHYYPHYNYSYPTTNIYHQPREELLKPHSFYDNASLPYYYPYRAPFTTYFSRFSPTSGSLLPHIVNKLDGLSLTSAIEEKKDPENSISHNVDLLDKQILLNQLVSAHYGPKHATNQCLNNTTVFDKSVKVNLPPKPKSAIIVNIDEKYKQLLGNKKSELENYRKPVVTFKTEKLENINQKSSYNKIKPSTTYPSKSSAELRQRIRQLVIKSKRKHRY